MGYCDFDPPDTRAQPQAIRRSAEELRSITGVLLGHGDNVGAVLAEVALSFSDVISSAIRAQIGNNVAALETAVEGTEYGYAVGSSWADDVDAFIATRADLVARWEADEANDFGVPPLTGLPNAEPELADRMPINRRETVEAARCRAAGAYTYEAQILWNHFQDRVDEKGRMFREGPNTANLELLVSYLGWGGMTLWPESATTPVQGAEDGAAAAATVVAGLDGGASPEDVAEALSTIAMITRRAAEGHELTDAELDYLEAFYGTLGIRILDVPAYLASTPGQLVSDPDAPPRYVPSLPFNAGPELVEALTLAAANGLLVLSRPTTRTDDDDHDGYERLPSWLRDTLAIEDNDPYNNPYVHFERLADLGDLLGHSALEAGTGLSRELAESVGWMIDYAEYREDSLSAEAEESMRAQIAASAPYLLNVVSRNDEVCLDLLTGSGMPEGFSPTEYFTDIYAFDWAVDEGAAAASLTDFIPEWAMSDDPVAQSRARDALFNLVGITTGDASFERLMDDVGTSGIAAESAVGQVNPAIAYGFAAAFAAVPGLFADDYTGAQLSFEQRVAFATLIGTDPTSGDAMSAALQGYEVQQTLASVTSGNIDYAGGQIGRLQRVVDEGLVAAALDAGADADDAVAAAAASRARGLDVFQSLIGTVPVIGDGLNLAIDIGRYPADVPGADTAESIDYPQVPLPTESERRFATVANVVQAMVDTGVVDTSAIPEVLVGPGGVIGLPPPVLGPPLPGRSAGPPVADYTALLREVVESAGGDVTGLLQAISSAYDGN